MIQPDMPHMVNDTDLPRGPEAMHNVLRASSDEVLVDSNARLIDRKPAGPQPTYTQVAAEDPETTETAGTAELPVNTNYNPFFTKRWVLLCFIGLWMVLIAALQVLVRISAAHQGLTTTHSSLSYFWVYGPTAFFIILTALWRQVDYASKCIQPWAEMAKGPAPASRSLLLDYVTPLLVKSLWKAIWYRHFNVAATISVFVLIKLITILSTGLFALKYLPFTNLPQDVRVVTQFDDSLGLEAAAIDDQPALAVYGANIFGLSLPNGTSSSYAFQQFELTQDAPNGTYTLAAEVDVFVPTWHCDTGSVTYASDADPDVVIDGTTQMVMGPFVDMTNLTMNISLPDCFIPNLPLTAPTSSDISSDGTNDTTGIGYKYGVYDIDVNCSSSDSTQSVSPRKVLAAIYAEVKADDSDNSTVVTVLNHSAVVCRPSYYVQPGIINTYLNGTMYGNITWKGTKREFTDITGDDFLTTMVQMLGSSSPMRAYKPQPSFMYFYSDFLRAMMLYDTSSDPANFLNNTWLNESSSALYREHTTQMVRQHLLAPTSIVTNGTITRMQLRLCIQEFPAKMMSALQSCALGLTVLMFFIIPQHVIPRHVDSIAGTATILARSPDLRKLLENAGHLDLPGLREALANHRFYTTIRGTGEHRAFSISTVDSIQSSAFSILSNHTRWKYPVILRRTVLAVILASAGVMAAILEVIYRVSLLRNGISDAEKHSVLHYFWLYFPVSLLVILATAFNCLNFELSLTHPFHELSRQNRATERTLLWVPLRENLLHTIVVALHLSRWVLLATSISVMVAPFLTIVASGLVMPHSVRYETDIDLNTLSWFNDSLPAGYFTEPSLILNNNMTYPSWTMGELAFPSFDVSEHIEGNSSVNASILVNTPALRAQVSCLTHTKSDFSNLTYYTLEFGGAGVHFTLNYTIPNDPANGNLSSSKVWDLPVEFPELDTTLDTPIRFGVMESLDDPTDFEIQANNGSAMPYIVIFGRIEQGEVTELAAITCGAGLETVQTNTTFDASNGRVIEALVDEASAKKVVDIYYPIDTFRPPHFDKSDAGREGEAFNDGFPETMVYGKDGVPMDELLNSETLIKQYTHTYRQWIAQALGTYSRQSVKELPDDPSMIAGKTPGEMTAILQSDKQRLFINVICVRVLQGLLAVMFICGCAIFVLIDNSAILPKQVGSIAAMASLLAGSKFVDENSGLIPPGAEWLSKGEIKKRRLWKNEDFSMGWWSQDDHGHRRNLSTDSKEAKTASHVETTEITETTGMTVGQFRIDCRPKSRDGDEETSASLSR
ncbi:hypothetical protein ES702_00141 [subsurface metagenome]